MPSVVPSSGILVTGASGFTGAWTVRALLDAGYTVRGTARSEAKAKYLAELFNSDRFTAVLIDDMSKVILSHMNETPHKPTC